VLVLDGGGDGEVTAGEEEYEDANDGFGLVGRIGMFMRLCVLGIGVAVGVMLSDVCLRVNGKLWTL
jgi:hypothetical protein